MAWTYSGDPKSSVTDQVRFICGDTNENDPLLQDGEIEYLLEIHKTAQKAGQEACISIMLKLSRDVDYSLGPEKVAASQRFEAYSKLYDLLKRSWVNSTAVPSWDSQNVKDAGFDIGMHDFVGGGSYGPTTES